MPRKTPDRWDAYTLLRENLRAAIGEYRPEHWRWSDNDLIETVKEMRQRLRLLEDEEQRW